MHYHSYEDLIENNKEWVNEKLATDAGYFEGLAKGQQPPFLFIGCSDSRMPLNNFTKTEPGELFIHRNVANQVSLTDMNLLAVLEYAVEALKIKHIVVCGHYFCGGVAASVVAFEVSLAPSRRRFLLGGSPLIFALDGKAGAPLLAGEEASSFANLSFRPSLFQAGT